MIFRRPLLATLAAFVLGLLMAEELRGLAGVFWVAAGSFLLAGACLAKMRWGGAERRLIARAWEGLPPDLDAPELPPDKARERDGLLRALGKALDRPLARTAETALLAGSLALGAGSLQPALERAALADAWAANLGDSERWWTGTVREARRYEESGGLSFDLLEVALVPGGKGPDFSLPGTLRLTVSPKAVEGVWEARPGDKIEFSAKLERAGDPEALGVTPTSDYQGRFFRARAASPASVRLASRERTSGVGWLEAMERSREALDALYRRAIPSAEASATVRAMCLGDVWGMSRKQRAAYANTGLIHLLAVSGLHVGLLGAALALVARALGMSPRAAAVLVILLVPLYAGLVGFRPPIARACAMTLVFALTWMAGWRVASLDTLALAAWAVLLAEPSALFLRGFQLSFLAAMGLIVYASRADFAFTPRTPARLAMFTDTRRPAWQRVWAHAIYSFARWTVLSLVFRAAWAAICVTLALAPLLALHANRIPLLGALGNVVAVPLATASVGLGFLAGLLLPFSQGGAELLASWAGVAAGWQNAAVSSLDGVPGASALATSPGPVVATLYYAMLFGLPLPPRRPVLPWTRAALRGSLLLRALGAGLVLALWGVAAPPGKGEMEIVFLDVGQGDSTLILMPGGAAILVDGGDRRPDAGQRVVLPYLASRGIQKLDAVVATHGDADHIGGLVSVLESIPVDILFEGELGGRNSGVFREWEQARKRAKRREALHSGWVLQDSWGARVFALWPAEGARARELSSNDRSAVLLVDYGPTEIILPGDAESAAEWALVEGGRIDDIEILKAGHHGSATSGSEPFLELAKPELVVVSCGRNNKYGFPRPEALDRYAKAGAAILRTDQDGSVRVVVGRLGWRVAE